MYRAGKFPVEGLSRVYEPSKIEEAIEDMKNGKVQVSFHTCGPSLTPLLGH